MSLLADEFSAPLLRAFWTRERTGVWGGCTFLWTPYLCTECRLFSEGDLRDDIPQWEETPASGWHTSFIPGSRFRFSFRFFSSELGASGWGASCFCLHRSRVDGCCVAGVIGMDGGFLSRERRPLPTPALFLDRSLLSGSRRTFTPSRPRRLVPGEQWLGSAGDPHNGRWGVSLVRARASLWKVLWS